MDCRNRRPHFPSKKVRIGRVRGLPRFAAGGELAVFVATLAGMAHIYLGPLLAQAI